MPYYRIVNRAGIALPLPHNPAIVTDNGLQRLGYNEIEAAIRNCPAQAWVTRFAADHGMPSREQGDVGWRDAMGQWHVAD